MRDSVNCDMILLPTFLDQILRRKSLRVFFIQICEHICDKIIDSGSQTFPPFGQKIHNFVP
jgi:hypothetical protein